MPTIIYTSFESIDRELEILALEKELSYQKMLISYEKLQENIQPDNIKREIFSFIRGKINNSFKEIFMYSVPFILRFLKRKRGD